MVNARDHKRAYDNDEGLNTGGMGTFSPSAIYTKEVEDEVVNKIEHSAAACDKLAVLYRSACMEEQYIVVDVANDDFFSLLVTLGITARKDKVIKNKYINIIKGKRDGKENFRREKRGLQRIGKKDFCRYKERAWHCR